MTRYPGAFWKPLPEAGNEPGNKPRLLIYHTIVGSAASAFNFFRDSTSLESHFIVPKAGPPWQIMESTDTADANLQANAIAISVETEDNGAPATDPWTDYQLTQLVGIGVWACQTFGIPARLADGPLGSGVGYHVMFGAPGPWTPAVGKTCPGASRIAQFHSALLPRIIAGVNGTTTPGGPFMALSDQEQVELLAATRDIQLVARLMFMGNFAGGDLSWLDVRIAAVLSAVAGINPDDPAAVAAALRAAADQLDPVP